MVIFHSYVSLPEGNQPAISGGFPYVSIGATLLWLTPRFGPHYMGIEMEI